MIEIYLCCNCGCIDCILGGKVDIKTLDNSTLSINTSSISNAGTVLSVGGYGLPVM